MHLDELEVYGRQPHGRLNVSDDELGFSKEQIAKASESDLYGLRLSAQLDKLRAFEIEAVRTGRLRPIVTPRDRQELYQAYSDSQNTASGKLGRSLNFWSDALYTAEQLRAVFPAKACPEGYNEFIVSTVEALTEIYGDSVCYQPARSLRAGGSLSFV